MAETTQSHSGSGDNVGGNKILNLSFPRLLALGIVAFLIIVSFIYWLTNRERFFFNEDKIDLAMSVTDSLQISGLNEEESINYSTGELVYYDFNQSGDTLEITPTSAYLHKLSQNKELPGERSGSYTQLYSKTPQINFKIANNSNKTIFFSKMELDVESSEIDPEPIPTFNVGECYINEGPKSLSLQIYNEGWSPMKNVKLDLNIIAPNEKLDYAHTPFKINYAAIEKLQLVDLFSILRKQGVDVERLIEATTENSEEDLQKPYIDPYLIQTGLGKYVLDPSKMPENRDEIIGIVYGWMSYEDVKGNAYRVKLKTPFNIYREWGCGAAGLETGAYDVALCETGKNYKIVYPVSQYLKTAEVDNFSVKLICPKSSVHRIRVKLFYADNKYIERYIRYHLIVPRRMVEDEVILFKGNGKCTDSNDM